MHHRRNIPGAQRPPRPSLVNGEYVLTCPDCDKTFRNPDRFIVVTDLVAHHALRCEDPRLIDMILNGPPDPNARYRHPH